MIPTLMLASCLAFDPLPRGSQAESPAQKIKAALDEIGVVAFENKSLNDYAAYVKSKLRVEVQIDHAAIAMMGIDLNAPLISLPAREGKLRDSFSQALVPLGLKIGAVGGTLIISTEDILTVRQMRQRVSVTSGLAGAVLSDLANRTGANVVIDPRQKKLIAEAACDLELTDVTLETAVRLAAEVSGFRAVRMGNVLFVTSNERAEKLRLDSDGPTQPLGPMAGVMGTEQGGNIPGVNGAIPLQPAIPPNLPVVPLPLPPPPVVQNPAKPAKVPDDK